jgi:hypothetical protein
MAEDEKKDHYQSLKRKVEELEQRHKREATEAEQATKRAKDTAEELKPVQSEFWILDRREKKKEFDAAPQGPPKIRLARKRVAALQERGALKVVISVRRDCVVDWLTLQGKPAFALDVDLETGDMMEQEGAIVVGNIWNERPMVNTELLTQSYPKCTAMLDC